MLEKHVGKMVEIVYVDRNGRITQRRIHIRSVRRGLVRAFCATSHAPRIFRADNILAVMPVKNRAV